VNAKISFVNLGKDLPLASICAWCHPGFSIPGVRLTHSVCKKHRELLLSEIRLKRAVSR